MQDELVKLSSNSKTNPHSSSCCLMTPKLMICSISKYHGITVNPQKCTQKGIHICYISKVAGFSESNPKKTIRLKILMPNAIWHLGIFLNDRQVVCSCSSAQTKLSRQVNHFFPSSLHSHVLPISSHLTLQKLFLTSHFPHLYK